MSQPFLSPLFTEVPGRGILRASLVECSRKFAKGSPIPGSPIPLTVPWLSGLRGDAQPSTCHLQVEGCS
jgi:hypothetical protein